VDFIAFFTVIVSFNFLLFFCSKADICNPLLLLTHKRSLFTTFVYTITQKVSPQVLHALHLPSFFLADVAISWHAAPSWMKNPYTSLCR